MAISIDASELADAVKRIGEVPDKLLRKGIRRGFASLSKEVTQKQKASLEQSKRSGKLRKSIGRKISVNLPKNKAYFVVGPRKKQEGQPSRYAHLVEKTTKPHIIKVNRGRNAGKTFKHPGTKAQPWLAPSYAGIQEKALRTVVDEIERTFKEVLK